MKFILVMVFLGGKISMWPLAEFDSLSACRESVISESVTAGDGGQMHVYGTALLCLPEGAALRLKD